MPRISEELQIASELSPRTLAQLMDGTLQVIWHPGFYPSDLCDRVLPRISEACENASYTLTADLQSLGTSIGEAAESAGTRTNYFETASATTQLIRDDLFRSAPSPLDRLRVLLDEYWPAGAHAARSADGRLHMLPGIVRRWPRGGQANPHIDQRENGVLDHLGLERRIGMNVYLEVPEAEAGGEIEFWWRISEDDYTDMRRDDYGLDRSAIGPAPHALSPQAGDLVMFDAAIIHGVAAVTAGSRVTAACFAGFSGNGRPLAIFA
ncbi:MAG TPA: 2OG-Fe(II) oxygenase [Solirubrobacteraceae bacterium]|jgi:hypothetical protein